jgi:hypothetical protein
MNKKILFTIMALCLPLVLTACQSPSQKASEKASEKLAETAIEKSTGGKANVDISGKNVSVDTKEGSMQTGENISLPADFPSDVYVYEGSIKTAITSNDPKGYTVSIETDKPLADIKAAYEQKIVADGWEKTGTMDFGETASVMGKKGNRNLSVMISKGSDKTAIVLTVVEEKN